MKSRIAIIVVVLIVAGLALGVALDETRVLRGLLTGERFHGGRPLSYWEERLGTAETVTRSKALAEARALGDAALPLLTSLATTTRGPNAARVRWTAAELLGELGPKAKSAQAELLTMVEDPDMRVRTVAVKSLALVEPDPRIAVVPLVDAARETTSMSVPILRTLATMTNCDTNQRRQIFDLCEMFLDAAQAPSETRWNAARTIGKLKGATRLSALTDRLTDADPQVREHSAEAIGDIGPEAAAAVVQLVGPLSDAQTKVRRDSARSLGQIVDDLGRQAGDPAFDPASLSDEKQREQVAAWRAAIERLIELRANDPQAMVREAADGALRAIAPEQARGLPPLEPVKAPTAGDGEAGTGAEPKTAAEPAPAAP
jgi:HEAT repeat protein